MRLYCLGEGLRCYLVQSLFHKWGKREGRDLFWVTESGSSWVESKLRL